MTEKEILQRLDGARPKEVYKLLKKLKKLNKTKRRYL
jgi:hypothetical protein